MISLENLRCPTCGATVAPPPPGATSVRCAYCGTEAMVHVPEPAPRPAPPPRMPFPMPVRPVEPYPEVTTPSSGAGVVVGVVLGIMALVGAIVGVAVVHDCGVGSTSFQWRNTVIPVSLDSDSVEDFVGVYASRSEKDYPVYVAAFDGAKQSELWRVGPFGKSAYEVKPTVVGSYLVVADTQPVLHIVPLATGKESGAITLSDKQESTCVPADKKNTLFVETADKRTVLVDLATAQMRAAPRPASCPPKPASDCDHVWSAVAGCADGDTAPKIDGFRAEFVLNQGNDAIAIGEKSPGTATPMAVAYDPKTQQVRWQKALVGSPTSAFEARLHAVDMAGGRLIAEYVAGSGKAGRLMALDAHTGSVLWDVEVPNTGDVAEASEMAITPTRVYLPHWTWLDLYDVKTGAHIATLGAW